MPDATVTIEYQDGTIAVRGHLPSTPPPEGGKHDERDGSLRFEAVSYAQVVMWLVRAKVDYQDKARQYHELQLRERVHHKPFPYQREALSAWWSKRRRGIVVLPTGAGKSYLAALAIAKTQRSTLVVVPTLDLASQWYASLSATFGQPVGLVGGGSHDIQDLCVTTYDSAFLHAERLGPRFGLVIYDECHHLPGASFSYSARCAIAPFRLGLTATLERDDGRHELLTEWIGPVAYRREITELSGKYLADYETVTLWVDLTDEEREAYEHHRKVYLDFLRDQRISMSSPDGWRRFIQATSRTPAGRRAMLSYYTQKRLAWGASEKMRLLERLLQQHRHERTLVFTQDNATAYRVSETFLIPVITHHTKPKERAQILQGLREGSYNAVVTSKVLNEGVDVPEANVAIILSGSGSVREHVQRLGRILRRAEGKQALLYEVVSSSTGERWVSQRRREHSAYR